MGNYMRLTPATKERKAQHWHPLKERLRHYLNKAGKGAAISLAKYLGCHSSQVHRWTCPVCEHDAEPSYSTAVEIIAFLTQWEREGFKPAPVTASLEKGVGKWVKHRKGNPKAKRIAADTRNVLNVLLPACLRQN